ncbi:MAG: hypothetical protein VXW65_13585 [Pseudomonadota bacterium]|nr:hypothetical protein [Pseudomonadota bacterium]
MTTAHTQMDLPFQPFADDNASFGIDGLTLENHPDRVVLYGNLELTRDQAGLAYARRLSALLAETVAQLEAAGEQLPDQIAQPTVETVDNPFL